MKLSERLEDACAGVLIAEATGNLNIMTRAVNKLLSEAREAAALARRVEGAGRAFIMSNEAPEPHQVAGVTAADDDVINTLDGQRVRLVPEVGS